MAAGGVQRLDLAGGIERFQRLAQADRQRDRRPEIEPAEAVEPAVEFEPVDRSPGPGLGPGRSVAVEIGENMDPRRKVRILRPQRGDARRDPGVQRRIRLPPSEGRKQVIEEGAGGGLPPLRHRISRQEPVRIGSPDPGPRRGGRAEAHEAGGGPGDQREVAPHPIGRVRESAERGERPGMGVDQPRRHPRPGPEPQMRRGRRGQGSQIRAHRRGPPDGADPGEIGQTQPGQRRLRPARPGAPAPFADGGTDRPDVAPRRRPGEEIAEVEDAPRPRPGLGIAAAQPQELRQRHLGRGRLARARARQRVQRLGLRDPPVVEPEQRVPVVSGARRHPDRRAGRVADHQRTGGVEGERGDSLGARARLGPGGAQSRADRLPDLGARLLRPARAVPAHRQRRLGAPEQPPARVKEAGARAAGAHVHRGEDSGPTHSRAARSRM